jgi:hypothetical protein
MCNVLSSSLAIPVADLPLLPLFFAVFSATMISGLAEALKGRKKFIDESSSTTVGGGDDCKHSFAFGLLRSHPSF